MREDMYTVIVERPRRGKRTRAIALRLRNALDGPLHLGMRAYYDYLDLNENLQPLRRYLRTQIGRPWNKVYSEICARIDRRNTEQQHIHKHIDQFIAVNVQDRFGTLFDLSHGDPIEVQQGDLYVDPRSEEIPFDVVLRRSLVHPTREMDRLGWLYGSRVVYGSSNRQLSGRELRLHNLVNSP